MTLHVEGCPMMERIHVTRVARVELGIFWIWQNSFILKTPDETLLAIDPHLVKNPKASYVAEPPMKPEELQVDYVFCTHDHWDHTDPLTLPLVAENSPRTLFLGTPECRQRFLSLGIPSERTQALEAGNAVVFRGFSVIPLYSVPPRVAAYLKLTTHFGYVFDFGSVRIYNFGDSTPETVADPMSVLGEVTRYRPEIAVFPIIGDYPSRRPEDAVLLTRTLKPQVVIPAHYGCFTDRTVDPSVFLQLMRGTSGVETVIVPRGGCYIHRAAA